MKRGSWRMQKLAGERLSKRVTGNNTVKLPTTPRPPASRRSAPLWMRGASYVLLGLVVAVSALGQQPSHPPDDESLAYSPRTKTGPLQSVTPDDLQTLSPLEDRIGRNEFAEALPELTRYVKEHPRSPRGHYDLGYLYFRTHQIGDSIRELSRSLQLNVDD